MCANFCYKWVHFGIFVQCILRFVRWHKTKAVNIAMTKQSIILLGTTNGFWIFTSYRYKIAPFLNADSIGCLPYQGLHGNGRLLSWHLRNWIIVLLTTHILGTVWIILFTLSGVGAPYLTPLQWSHMSAMMSQITGNFIVCSTSHTK